MSTYTRHQALEVAGDTEEVVEAAVNKGRRKWVSTVFLELSSRVSRVSAKRARSLQRGRR